MMGKQEGRVRQLRVEEISPSPYQARSTFPPEALSSLAVSIGQSGILQPLAVRRTAAGYELIAGERRLRAARMAGLTRVPCLVCTAGEEEARLLCLTENLYRQNLTCFEEAEAIEGLLSAWGCTQGEAARRLGMAQPTLANKLRLLALTHEERALCEGAGLTERHARAVLRLKPEKREAALACMGKKGMNVAGAEAYVAELLAREQRPQRPPLPPLGRGELRLFLNTLNRAVALVRKAGLPAAVTRGEGEGYIEYTVRIPAPGAPKEGPPGKKGGEEEAQENFPRPA